MVSHLTRAPPARSFGRSTGRSIHATAVSAPGPPLHGGQDSRAYPGMAHPALDNQIYSCNRHRPIISTAEDLVHRLSSPQHSQETSRRRKPCDRAGSTPGRRPRAHAQHVRRTGSASARIGNLGWPQRAAARGLRPRVRAPDRPGGAGRSRASHDLRPCRDRDRRPHHSGSCNREPSCASSAPTDHVWASDT